MRVGASSIPEAPAPAISHRSLEYVHPLGWHSQYPVPYLFGGLAAMMGLIAFALLILACSYWKLSGFPSDGTNAAASADLQHSPPQKPAGHPRWENSVVVIMAGQGVPTFLATVSSIGDGGSDNTGAGNTTIQSSDGEKIEKVEDVVLEEKDDDLSHDHHLLRLESQN